MDSKIKIITTPNYSDGDVRHRPDDKQWKILRPANLWLHKLAEGWMKHRGEAVEGVQYYLDKLPAGYEVFEKRRKTGGVDKRLFGCHRSYFDSPNRFMPHFIHLMENNGSDKGCSCTICSRSAERRSDSSDNKSAPTAVTALPVRSRAGSRSTGRGWGSGRGAANLPATRSSLAAPAKHVDEEGTEDVYLTLLDKLQREGHINEAIEEELSMDWRAENTLLKEHLAKTSGQPMRLPRLGEIVLFVRDNGHGITEPVLQWEAGIITQLPQSGGGCHDAYQVNYTGYRVEPLPDPNSNDKSLSKRFKYVPLNQIRPFILWKEILHEVPEAQWQPSIWHALTIMSTFSLLNPYRFSGTWPTAEISCKGIFLGSELVLVGDMVRMTPASAESQRVTDILEVGSIKLKLHHFDEDDDNDEDAPPYSTAIHITGKAFTTEDARGTEPVNLPDLQRFAGYGKHWYSRHSPRQSYQVPFTRILGRLWEAAERTSDIRRGETAYDLSEGLEAVREARAFSSQHLRCIPEGKSWFWADNRAQALDLETLNGQEVAAHDKERDPQQWRRQLKILKDEADERERQPVKAQSQRLLRAFEYDDIANATLQAVDSEDVSMGGSGGDDSKRSASHGTSVDAHPETSEDEDAQAAEQLVGNLVLPMDDEMLLDSENFHELEEPTEAKRINSCIAR